MKRIKYFDFLRVICFAIIIWYHMLTQLSSEGLWAYGRVYTYTKSANIHIPKMAVAVFFMLSGASLMLASQKDFHVKTFYRKRLLRILIPFYITSIGYAIYKVIEAGSISEVFGGRKPWTIIFSFLGMDAWVGLYGIQSYSIGGIGEWFLGCLIVLYLIFPLLRTLILKNKELFLTVCTAIYIVIIFNYHFNVPMHMNIICKAYDFILGMYLSTCWNKVDRKYMKLIIPGIIFWFVSPVSLNLNDELNTTIISLLFFTGFSFMEGWLQKGQLKAVDILSKYSYELFLVHHVVIKECTHYFLSYLTCKRNIMILFMVEFVISLLLAWVVKQLSDRGKSWILQIFHH